MDLISVCPAWVRRPDACRACRVWSGGALVAALRGVRACQKRGVQVLKISSKANHAIHASNVRFHFEGMRLNKYNSLRRVPGARRAASAVTFIRSCVGATIARSVATARSTRSASTRCRQAAIKPLVKRDRQMLRRWHRRWHLRYCGSTRQTVQALELDAKSCSFHPGSSRRTAFPCPRE